MDKRHRFHERFDREEASVYSSDRNFCLWVAAGWGLAEAYQWCHGHAHYALAAGCLSAMFLLSGLIRPSLAAPLKRLWMHVGLRLAALTNPLFLALIYGIAVVPTGLAMRLAGKDPLRRKRDPAATTYWIARTPPGPAPETMKHLF